MNNTGKSILSAWYLIIAFFIGILLPVFALISRGVGFGKYGIPFIVVSGLLSFFCAIVTLVILVLAIVKKWSRKDFYYIFSSF